MKIVNIKNVPQVKVNMDGAYNAYKKIPISKADGTPLMSMRVFTIEPNGYTPYHSHNYEQLNYIIEGKGILINNKGEEIPLSKGDFVLVLPNEIHQYKNNSSNENFTFICCVPKEYE